MLVHFFCALSSAWFSIAPLQVPKESTMHGEAIVRLIDKIPKSYIRGEYEMQFPGVGDTVLVNMPNGNNLQWAVIVELMPTIKGGCNEF